VSFYTFERVDVTCIAAGVVKAEGFAVDATVVEANAVVTMARRQMRSSGPSLNARRARSRNISRRSR
jgi:hypothetical protein